jgi:molybdopterin converting factor subunit 1
MRSSIDEMIIHLKMFAILRERSGVGEAELQLPEGADVSQAVAEAARQFPKMADLLPAAAVAVNLDYAQRQAVLRDGDELALIPPVSGG